MRIRIGFATPQRFGHTTLSDVAVDAERIECGGGMVRVVLGGEVSFESAADEVTVIDLTEETVQDRRRRAERLAAIRRRHPQHGKPWSEEETAELTRLWSEGVRVADLMTRFQRSRRGIESRLEHLGHL